MMTIQRAGYLRKESHSTFWLVSLVKKRFTLVERFFR
jgi:hypothetical protein